MITLSNVNEFVIIKDKNKYLNLSEVISIIENIEIVSGTLKNNLDIQIMDLILVIGLICQFLI